MKHNINIALLLLLALFTSMTYAAGKSLWGDIDVAEAPPTPVIEVVEPVQKSICEILRTQATLDPNIMSTPAMQDALRNNITSAPAAYKGILSNTASLTNLYTQYRGSYLKAYCS